MSKKSKDKRAKRKSNKLRLAERAKSTRSESSTLADAKVRQAVLRNLVRQMPPDLKSRLVSRCGSPEKVTFLLLADPAHRFDGGLFQWPIAPQEGVTVLLAPGATEKVALTAGVILPRQKNAEVESISAFESAGQRTN